MCATYAFMEVVLIWISDPLKFAKDLLSIYFCDKK